MEVPQAAVLSETTNPAPAPAVVPVFERFSKSLYVGDLEASINEKKLFDLFNRVVPVASIRVCRDRIYGFSLGYGYVNFLSLSDAYRAKDTLNFTIVNGRPIRIMFSQRDPTMRKSGFANLYIKNLALSIDAKELHETFSIFGRILSCKVELDANGRSKGFGFVQFDKEESAENAIKRLNGLIINDKKMYVAKFIPRQERIRRKGLPKFTNVYVKNFSKRVTDEDLKKIFGRFGPITSAVVMKDANGNSRLFGFVNYENSSDAVAAVENLNGTSLDDKVLYVGRAEKKAKRIAKLKAKFEHERNIRFEEMKGANLYFKNISERITSDDLKMLFSRFGTITSYKIMCDSNGVSKRFGFVAFSNSEEAINARNSMHATIIAGKLLYVAVAQRKEERKAWLQAYHLQKQNNSILSRLRSRYDEPMDIII
ncbi:polyadenylate-binding protein 5-like [Andrographis paniculata]|uniref:polyadenylate-binding protein 5-like n=1 Tax=Andrographis paniculata TaxID=175694 RepID=UPI0021E860CA|nr:polyadenylate-binding protein 5-like [Andrographis paniculata]